MSDQTPDKIEVTDEGGILESYDIGSLGATERSAVIFAGFGIDVIDMEPPLMCLRFEVQTTEGKMALPSLAMSFGSAQVLAESIFDVIAEMSARAAGHDPDELTDSVDSGEDKHSE